MRDWSPDDAVVDLHMPVMDGFATIAWLKEHRPEVLPLALTFDPDDDALVRAVRAGARGFLRKNARSALLKHALDSLVLTGWFQTNATQQDLIEREGFRTRQERERERILEQIAPAKWNSCCSYAIRRSTPTSRSRIKWTSPADLGEPPCGLVRKFALKSKTGLVLFAVQLGLAGAHRGWKAGDEDLTGAVESTAPNIRSSHSVNMASQARIPVETPRMHLPSAPYRGTFARLPPKMRVPRYPAVDRGLCGHGGACAMHGGRWAERDHLLQRKRHAGRFPQRQRRAGALHTHTWTPGTGLNDPNVPAPVTTSEHQAPPPTLTIGDSNGCTDTDQVTVTVQPAPNLALNAAAPVLTTTFNGLPPALRVRVANFTFNFTDASSAAPGSTFSVDWGSGNSLNPGATG